MIEVDLPVAEPRLVVDASINWRKGTDGTSQTIRLTKTAGYYEPQVPGVEDADVYITNSSISYIFINNGAGYYVCDSFVPQVGETYTLHIEHQGELFTATETLMPTPELLYGDHTSEGIRAYFNDPVEENFYLSDFFKYGFGRDTAVFDDRFVNGNLTFTMRFLNNHQPGDTFGISLYGISERYYNYMMRLSSIADTDDNPFQTPSVMVRGNVVNQTNPANFAFGYFRLSEESFIEYTVH